MTGAQFEIRIDGAPRTYRDRKDYAMEAARLIKNKNPVEVRDLRSGDVTAVAQRPGWAMPLKLRPAGLGSGIDKDRPDYTVFTGEWEIGRIYQTSTRTNRESPVADSDSSRFELGG
jgi:hypothetical protein